MKRLYILFLLFAISVSSWGYSSNIIVDHYTTENGLPNNIIYCSLKDTDGFQWFGTWYGLARFDGIKFKTFNRSNLGYTDIPPRKILRIIEDKNNYLWLLTIDRKLYLFDKKKERFHAIYDDMKKYSENIQVIKIEKSIEGNILLLTKDKTLLLASSTDNGSIHLTNLFDSKGRIDLHTFQLRHNELIETTNYLSWEGKDYKISAYRKGKTLHSKSSDYIISQLKHNGIDGFISCYTDKNMLWLGTSKGIICSIDPINGKINKLSFPEISSSITSIIKTHNNLLYFSVKGNGVYCYNLSNRQLSKTKADIDEESVAEVYVDKYNKLWFYEKNKNIVFYNPKNGQTIKFPLTIKNKICDFNIQDGGERGIFFISEGGESFIFERETNKLISLNELIPNNEDPKQQFLHILFDRDNSFWLTSASNGIYRMNFPKKQFKLLPMPFMNQHNSSPGVRSLFCDKDGNIWVGTRWRDLYMYDKKGNLKETFTDGKDGIGVVYHIMEDKKGNLWFSTKGNGLVKGIKDLKYPKGIRFIKYMNDPSNPNSISGNEVYYTFQDSNNRIWVGLLDGGLNLIEGNDDNIIFRNKNNGFVNYPKYGLYMETRNIIEDNKGRIWVGTMDGLMSFNKDFGNVQDIEFETYRNIKGAFNDTDVYSMYKDHENNIWVCMFGNGLSRITGYNNKRHFPLFEFYGVNEGLSNDVVMSMVEDNSKRLWFTSDGKLSYYNNINGQIRTFDKFDGLPQVKLEDNAAIKLSNGDIWLGCKQGILTFNPGKLEPYKANYKTYIVGCNVLNRDINTYTNNPIAKNSITYTKSIELKYNQSMFNIEFAALNFNNQSSISYRYILDGYEDKWHYNGKNRIASYTNVPPGKYKFRVETIDDSNPKLNSFSELDITILPPWWATIWAYMIYTVIAALAIFYIIKFALFMIKVKNDIYIEQRLAELKIKFFTNISHELRTPLTLIAGPIQELKEEENLSKRGYTYIDLMEKNLNHMLQLVNQILDFRKIQNGKMKLHVSFIDLNKIASSLYDEFKMLAEEKEINLSIQLNEDSAQVWADKDKISTVVRNLLSNAFKFTDNDGNILITVGKCQNKESYYLKVEDDGKGIPQNKLVEIFNRFSQVDNMPEHTYNPGTGIGLALSRDIINLHHGNIYAESPNGEGAIFCIELREDKKHFNKSDVDYYLNGDEKEIISQKDKEEESNEDSTSVDSKLPSLLIIDDNKDLCSMLKLQLEDKFNIRTANDGVEGLKKVHLYHPDLIVTDQMMPNMDGIEMLKHIRKDFQISHLPVIILSAKSDEEARTKAISLGANAYIVKPFSKEYLIARMEQLLNERKIFRERMWQDKDAKSEEENSYEEFMVKKDVEFIDKIHKIIEENIDNEEFNIDTISSSIGLSRSAFFKKLKSLTGFAPVDLVKEVRLNKSVELLKNSNLTITEIAFAVGFKDSGYFTKCFKKKYNQAPREFISEIRKK